MILFAHRVNTIRELKKVPPELGVEVDLRDRGRRIILQHDPYKDGEDFRDYLKHFRHRAIILNIKSERIEFAVLDLIKAFKVRQYFFLDSSFPMIVALSRQGEHNMAVRFSEFENLATVLAMKGRARWVWVDCFSRLPLNVKSYQALKKNGFKICLVSPELQGRPGEVAVYKKFYARKGLAVDAVCTKSKFLSVWQGADAS